MSKKFIPQETICKVCQTQTVRHKRMHPALDFSQITTNIFIGTNACCMTHLDERLLELGITADISLEAKQPDAPKGASYYLWLPVKDHSPPIPQQIAVGIAVLREFEKRKIKVYVHCEHGHGRAPTLVAAYLMTRKHWSAEQAMHYLTKHRPVVHLTEPQWAALHTLGRDSLKKVD